ncbi:hypothetical protein WJ60_29410 [Burkholderia ubonensis]|nr:hypothetical protein WJ60_29410 [Burkholderia ubonensis]
MSITKKTVHNSDVSKLSKGIKSIKNEIETKYLGQKKGVGEGLSLDRSDVDLKISKFVREVETMISKLDDTRYQHNPKKLQKLNDLVKAAKKLGAGAHEKRGFNDRMKVGSDASKIRSHEAKQSRSKESNTTMNGSYR